MKKFANTGQNGFTLVDLVVGISIFTVVVTLTIGALVQGLRNQKQVTGLIAANNAMSLTIEQIAREMRTGFNFSSATPSDITFTNARGQIVTYSLLNGAIERRASPLGIPGASFPITADNVTITYLNFSILSSPTLPTRITVSMGASPKEGNIGNIILNLQTTISPRFL